jgi:hypothetical protein
MPVLPVSAGSYSNPRARESRPDFVWPYRSNDAAQHQSGATDDREDDGADLEPSLCGVTASAVPLIEGAVEDGEVNDDHDVHLGWTRTGAFGNTFDLEVSLA